MARWSIDWRIEGSVTVEAASAEEAQAIFDKRFGAPNFATWQSGEMSNDDPQRVDTLAARRTGD